MMFKECQFKTSLKGILGFGGPVIEANPGKLL